MLSSIGWKDNNNNDDDSVDASDDIYLQMRNRVNALVFTYRVLSLVWK